LVTQGFVTGASDRNWASCRDEVTLPAAAPDWQRKILTDPQTSGGLLVACDPATAPEVLALFKREGFAHVAEIGRLTAGAPRVKVQ
jgi:selenide,water dikinase